MKESIIEDTKKFLITQYGEPHTSTEGDTTYKILNAYLDAFESFISSVEEIASLLNIELTDAEIKLLCNFAKSTEYLNTQAIARRINSIIKRYNQGKGFGCKNRLIALFDKLSVLAKDKDYDCRYLINLFKYTINCSKYSVKYRDVQYSWVVKENTPLIF